MIFERSIAYLALFVRVFVFVNFSPHLRTYLPLSARTAICASLSIVSFCFAPIDFPASSISWLFFTETLYGACLALPISLMLYLLPYLGRQVDVFRGAQFAELVMPGSGEKVTSLEQLGDLLALFLLSIPVVSAQFLSKLLYPISTVISSEDGRWSKSIIFLFGDIIALGFCIAAPVALSCFFLDCASGLISRFAKRINLVSELMPIKLLLGLAVVLMIVTSGDNNNLEQRVAIQISHALAISSSIYMSIVDLGGV